MTNSTKQSKWYDKTWLVTTLCIIFFPVGIYGLWKNETISKGWKIGVTAFFGLLVLSQIGNNKTDGTNNADNTDKNKSIEELPPLKTCESNIGKVKTNGNGSIGKTTEFTELAKLLKSKDCEILEVTFIQLSPPDRNYEDMDLKITYNRTTGVLQNIFTKTNVIEEYKNINEKCLTEFLKSGSHSFASISKFCKDSKYDFNNREMTQTAIGEKPSQSELTSSVKIVEDYVKANAKDESSVEFLEWSKVTAMGENWVVRAKFKGTNSYGAVVTENSWFYIQNGQVVNTKIIQ